MMHASAVLPLHEKKNEYLKSKELVPGEEILGDGPI